MIRVTYLGGTYGNVIYYFDNNNDPKRIYGFKSGLNTFSDGSVMFDLVNYRQEKSIPLFLITDIEFEDSPHDMFFANIHLLGYVKNPQPLGEYKHNWYEPYIEDLLEEYQKKLKELSFFEIKRRRFVKKAIHTLQLMANKNNYNNYYEN